jgi:hypothetical protein
MAVLRARATWAGVRELLRRAVLVGLARPACARRSLRLTTVTKVTLSTRLISLRA